LLETTRPTQSLSAYKKTYAAPSTIHVYPLLPEQHAFANTFQTGIAMTLTTTPNPYKTT